MKQKSLLDTIYNIMLSNPNPVIIGDVAREIEIAVKDHSQYKHLDSLTFIHRQDFVTAANKHLYLELEGLPEVYKIKLVNNNNIILKAEIITPY